MVGIYIVYSSTYVLILALIGETRARAVRNI